MLMEKRLPAKHAKDAESKGVGATRRRPPKTPPPGIGADLTGGGLGSLTPSGIIQIDGARHARRRQWKKCKERGLTPARANLTGGGLEASPRRASFK